MIEPATRIIVYAGFHRTGTTSIHHWLRKNREVLHPHAKVLLREDFEPVELACRAYGLKPGIWRLKQVRQRLDAFLAGLEDHPQIVLSCECFSGVQPGRRRLLGLPILSYRRAAGPLAAEVAEALRARFGNSAELTFLYTLRAPQPWLRSVHARLATHSQLALEADDFIRRQSPIADLEAEAAEVARCVAPARIVTRWLEEIAQHELGPASAMVEQLELPGNLGRRFVQTGPMAVSPDDDTISAFIERNRRGGTPDELRADKLALIKAAAAPAAAQAAP